ncbi:MAG: RNA polymerase sigma factor [Prolixibacteraceae bacterium]|nr:RNA polymerase sigma factor [Prolixibacteraceae bacterium]
MPKDDLIQRLKNPSSKSDAFRDLVESYQQRIYWHIRKMVISHDDADDILQNVFIKIWNNIDSFREESGLYTWVFRIATNETLTFLSQQKRRAQYTGSMDNDFLSEQLTSDPYIDGTDIQLRLQKAILTLPDKQRMVFNMKYFDEMKYNDMAGVLGTSVGALKASYHHAVKKIEEYLKKEELY